VASIHSTLITSHHSSHSSRLSSSHTSSLFIAVFTLFRCRILIVCRCFFLVVSVLFILSSLMCPCGMLAQSAILRATLFLLLLASARFLHAALTLAARSRRVPFTFLRY